MTFQEQCDYFQHLDDWFSSPHGRIIAKVIEEELSHLKEIVYGNRLVQLGSCGTNPWLHELPFPHQWIVKPTLLPTGTHCVSSLNALPIERDSIDCLIAPFTVDCFSSKESVIDEIDRVLKPMGYAIFLGINPFSLWGLWLRFSNQNCYGHATGFPKSLIALKRMMAHRGYSHCYCNEFYFIPPVEQLSSIRALSFLNQVGKMVSPLPSAFYCLVMRKQVENYIGPVLVQTKKEFIKNSPAYQPVC